jgi:hypothetical protein
LNRWKIRSEPEISIFLIFLNKSTATGEMLARIGRTAAAIPSPARANMFF